MERVLLKEIADVKLCIVSSSKKKECDEAVEWITLSSLLPFNGTGELLLSSEYYPDEDIKVKKHDIIMKRVAPTGVNYIEDDINAYVYNNLFIIRTKENVSADYLAAYLDENIEDFVKGLARGSVAPSIGRKDLLEIEIDLPGEREQNAIGGYWRSYNAKKRLENKLTQLEQIKNREIFNIIRNKDGGKR